MRRVESAVQTAAYSVKSIAYQLWRSNDASAKADTADDANYTTKCSSPTLTRSWR